MIGAAVTGDGLSKSRREATQITEDQELATPRGGYRDSTFLMTSWAISVPRGNAATEARKRLASC
jgi:hypothetical protein